MKTLIIISIAVFNSLSTNAQFAENFDQNLTGLSSNCWLLNQVNYSTTSGDVINGTGSAYTNPPTSSSGERSIATPFLTMATTSLSVSFKYKTSSKISGNATRTINIGISDRNGNFTLLHQIVMDKHSSTSVLSHVATYTIPSAGVYRLELRIGGATGDGNSRIIFDDLYADATPYYGPTIHCNPAAIAVNDTYTSSVISPVSDNVLTNDNIPADNEIYSVSLVAAPANGTLVINTDGSFSFTPDPSFTGGTITFSYQITDNGYPAATSNIAIVSIQYPAPVILPMVLVTFSSVEKSGDAVIQWQVRDLHEGNYFEVQKSLDGKEFYTIYRVEANAHSEKYSTIDRELKQSSYYRLKMVNKDHTVGLSKTTFVSKTATAPAIRILGNPVTNVLRVQIPTGIQVKSARLYSITGVHVLDLGQNVPADGSIQHLDVQSLVPGSYVVVISTGAGSQSIKFIKK